MKLHRQLVAVGLLTLALPWAGCQYTAEMGKLVREGQAAALAASARAIAARLSADPNLLPVDASHATQTLYAHPLAAPMIVDGYRDDWQAAEIPLQQFTPTQPFSAAIGVAQWQQQLFAFIGVDSSSIRYQRPGHGLDQSDYLLLSTPAGDYAIYTSAPGNTIAREFKRGHLGRQNHSIVGRWLERSGGYQVELKLPLTIAREGFGIAARDSQTGELSGTRYRADAPAVLVTPDPQLQQALQIFTQPGQQLAIIDRHGWQLAASGSLEHTDYGQHHWLAQSLYRLALRQPLPPLPPASTSRLQGADIDAVLSARRGESQQWYQYNYRGGLGTMQLGRASAAIEQNGRVVGAVVVSQSSDALLQLTGSAFNRLLLYSIAASLVAGLGLLFYASWLSWRIRRLQQAAARAVDSDGQIVLSGHWPSAAAGDELGDLARDYRDLLQRLGAYTDYLRSLSGKLSHELRTPLAVVRTSLDNLEHETLGEQARLYWRRASEGSARLSQLISAMSEASRVEQSIQRSECENFDLAELLEQLLGAYQDVYPRRLSLSVESGDYRFWGSPELMVQLLDKLSDNACDFCPEHGEIRYRLQRTQNDFILSVENDGPLLPDSMREQLFDSLVSIRDKPSDQPHLGLGLHIVRLICQFHRAQASAHNRSDGSGVVFQVQLPVDRRK